MEIKKSGPGKKQDKNIKVSKGFKPILNKLELEDEKPKIEKETIVEKNIEQKVRKSKSSSPKLQLQSAAISKRSKLVISLYGIIAFITLVCNQNWINPEYSVTPPNVPIIPSEIVVDLVDSISDQEITDLGKSLGIKLRYNSIFSEPDKLMVARVNPAQREDILSQLKNHPLVEISEPQYIFKGFAFPQTAPDDPNFQWQWHLKMINVEKIWPYTLGAGVVVAVVDTGVTKVSDFNNTVFERGYDFIEGDEDASDSNFSGTSHGTHVAATIAESTNNRLLGAGVAPEAVIFPIRVIGKRGGRSSDVAEGIKLAADKGADVINLSLGGRANSQLINNAVIYAHQKGSLLVCAMGNDSKQPANFPAQYKECIGVSSVGPNKQIVPYSSWGGGIDIAAPGGDLRRGKKAGVIQSTLSRGREAFIPLQGTSMAAPHVSGAAALIVSLGFKGDPEKVKAILKRVVVEPKSPQEHYGAGILNFEPLVGIIQQSVTSQSHQVNSTSGSSSAKSYQNKLPFWGMILQSSLVFWSLILVAVACLLVIFFGNIQSEKLNSILSCGTWLVLGMLYPSAIENVFGFGSFWNMLGHSLIVPTLILFYFSDVHVFSKRIMFFIIGIIVQLILDALSSTLPLFIEPQWVLTMWLYVNIVYGVWLLGKFNMLDQQN